MGIFISRIVFAAGILASVSACAPRVKAVVAPTTFPEVGTMATRNVGDSLISHGYARLVPRLTIEEDAVIGETTIRKGTYTFNAENADRIKFLGGSRDIFIYKDTNKVCIGKGQCSDVKFSTQQVMWERAANSFQQTLLYNGKIGEKITIGYREFSGDIARPAFSNEVSYDLSESKIIGYKGARIEVVRATNTEITYKVLSGFVQ